MNRGINFELLMDTFLMYFKFFVSLLTMKTVFKAMVTTLITPIIPSLGIARLSLGLGRECGEDCRCRGGGEETEDGGGPSYTVPHSSARGVS